MFSFLVTWEKQNKDAALYSSLMFGIYVNGRCCSEDVFKQIM